MKGLLRKEYYVMKRYGKTYLLFLLCFGGAAVFTGSIAMFGAMAMVFMTNIPLSSFTLDEACSWDQLAVATPVSRKAIVGSKYLLFFIMTGLTLLLSTGIVLLSGLMRPNVVNYAASLSGVFASVGTMGMVMMILLPIIIKLGIEKGRIVMMIAFISVFAIILLAGVVAEQSQLLGSTAQGLEAAVLVGALVVMPLLLLGMAALSYGISCRIYAKREF